MNPCERAILIKKSNITIQCDQKNGRCNYHKKGESLSFSSLTPGGLCPEAYNAVYFFTLGLLFNAERKEQDLIVKCPNADNHIVLKANFEQPSPIIKLLNLVKSMVKMFYPVQILKDKIIWRIIDAKGSCPYGHKSGNKFTISLGKLQITKDILINIGESMTVCPALFAYIYPHLFAKETLYESKDINTVQCPDYKADIIFTIKTKEGQ